MAELQIDYKYIFVIILNNIYTKKFTKEKMFLLYIAVFVISLFTSNAHSAEFDLYNSSDFSTAIITQAASKNDLESLAKIATSIKLHSNHFFSILYTYNMNIKKNGSSEDTFNHANQALSICYEAISEIPVEKIDADSLTFLNTMTAYIRNTSILRKVLTAIEKHYSYNRGKIESKYGKAHKAAINVCACIDAIN